MCITPRNSQATNGKNSTPVRPTRLILDDDYTAQAIEIIDGARHIIRVSAYAWRWYENEPEIGIQKLNIAIVRALIRGVRVQCLLDTNAMKTQFTALGFNCRTVEPNRMLHTKAICVDTTNLIIGSHNLTKRANTDNYEMSIITDDYTIIEQFIVAFENLWGRRANR